MSIKELILVEARKSKKNEEPTKKILSDGFDCNGIHYVRYGKSSSQGKDGITLFINKLYYDEMFVISQLDIVINECVISKYESQRNLTLSNCTLVKDKLPYIIIIDEYKKTIPNQYIRFVEERSKEIVDKKTGEKKNINVREIKEGYKDIKLSPFDGCGCHTHEMSEKWSNILELKYTAIGFQIRLPFLKGYSVEVPFKKYYESINVTQIKDIFGKYHNVNDIDCIWNISMWKGYGIFKEKHNEQGFTEYINTLNKYKYYLGIAKYSHSINNINLKTRMNFQYLQCLNLWNQKYIDWFQNKDFKYNILDKSNNGIIVNLATYTTNLYEKIINGNKFYTCKFLGIDDSDTVSANSKYLEAILKNDTMLKDPAIKQYIYRKLKKAITQAKYGKIYADGFYHTCVGDMIGYLQYAAGNEVVGCLNAHEFYCDTIPKGNILSFRSPLVCPSEVNAVKIVENDLTQKWFSHFKMQDVVMINMYDLSMPQQGGMDEDGDAIFLCHDPLLVNTKVNKTIIIDIDDKITSKIKPYTKENIIEYEMNSRDNRIGEITNVATAILNQYVVETKWKIINDDNISLLRIVQGKEIDSQKTGVRWQLNKWMRKCGKKVPYFLLYNYPDKLNHYKKMQIKNSQSTGNKLSLNAYHSPSPLNELCDYIDSWEKKKVLWNRSCCDTSCLILDNTLDLSDPILTKLIRHILNDFTVSWREAIEKKDNGEDVNVEFICNQYLKQLHGVICDDKLLANYCIKVAYSNISSNKSLVWHLFGDEILINLTKNSPIQKRTKIVESPSYSPNAFEYLNKYYIMLDGDDNV